MSNYSFCYFSVFARQDQNVALKQLKSLVNAGFKVTMVVSDDLPDENKGGIHITSIKAKSQIGSYFKRLFVFPFLFLKKLNQIDAEVYQTCDVDTLIICLFLILKGKKIVFNLLESHPYSLNAKLNVPIVIKCVIIWLVKQLMKLVLKRVEVVYTVSLDIKYYLESWGIKNVEIMGNYPLYREDHDTSLEEYLNRENKIIYFGAIYSISRQEVFFDALASCNNVKYLLAGDFGKGNYRQQLEHHPMWERIEFVNRFEKSSLYSMLDGCTISNVLRDFKETGSPHGSFGVIKLFESMEAGLPIICSDVETYREMMKDYQCGILVDPNNAEQIRKAITYLVNNKEEAYRMGQEGRRAIRERYNWALASKEYLIKISNLYN